MDIGIFIVGFVCGMFFIITTIILALVIISNKQSKNMILEEEYISSIPEESIKDIVRKKRERFTHKNTSTFGIGGNVKLLRETSLELLREISTKYHPDSKYPLFELTVEEALELNIHISERILRGLSDKKLEVCKKLKISSIIQLNDFKKTVENNPIYKKLDEYKLINIVSKLWMTLNIANPKYWVKKIVIDGGLEVAYRGLSIVVLNAIGKEAYSTYSRGFKRADIPIIQDKRGIFSKMKDRIKKK